MREIREIIVHCSATPEGRDVKLEDIDKWHREKGYKGVGYHYVIELDGKIRKGRSEERIGAHCVGHNSNSIGVCYIGGCDKRMRPKDTRTPAQKESLIDLLIELKRKYPNAIIRGHRDFANKACPSFDATDSYSDIK